MAGKPFKVGSFAHTLRVRLMREHVGVDVDALTEEDLLLNKLVQKELIKKLCDSNADQVTKTKQVTPDSNLVGTTSNAAVQG